MAITETNRNFYEETGIRLSSISHLNLFPILIDNDGSTRFLNLFRSYRINDDVVSDVVFYDSYEVSNGEYWDDIAFNVYGIPQMWWIIALINNISNPFEELEAGDTLKILKESYVYTLMNDISTLSEL